MESKEQRVYFTEKESTNVICGECRSTRRFQKSEIPKFGIPVSLKCKCGNRFTVIFDIRRHYRKSTLLIGNCSRNQINQFYSDVEVFDISLSGIGFSIQPATSIRPKLEIGDFLHIQFTLDDMRRETINANIVVRSINGDKIGAEFINLDEACKKYIGFYLM